MHVSLNHQEIKHDEDAIQQMEELQDELDVIRNTVAVAARFLTDHDQV